MKRKSIPMMKPQDVVVLLKLIIEEGREWTQISLARSLFMSQSEISESISRSTYAKMILGKDQKVARLPLVNFIQFGIEYVFPQSPGSIVRGIPTAHSASPLSNDIVSEEAYVWPYSKGTMRGHAILPLYPSVTQAVALDSKLHEYLALIDAFRVGRAREKSMAIDILKSEIG